MIADPYLLVLNVPLHRYEGTYWADPLWRKDLEAHRAQIAHLSIACPVADGTPPAGWERLSHTDIGVHPLPSMGRSSWLALPLLTTRLWQAIGSAQIVHTGVAGWPFPLGWIAVPIGKVRRRFVVVVIESAFWRNPPGTPRRSILARARASIWETINRALIRRCDVSFFTTASYRDTLHPHGTMAGTAHVLPAVWVDDDRLIAQDTLAALGPAKDDRLLFAGRLTTEKGVLTLLDAVRQARVPVDIIGEGDLRDVVAQAQRDDPELIRLLAPVDYGDAFFALLDRYAALIVPTISDEQPRIVFDAFARGVAVLASATTGNRDIVDQGRTGLLYPPNDAAALAATLVEAARDPARLHTMGTAARRAMSTQTHAGMHETRAGIIADALTSR